MKIIVKQEHIDKGKQRSCGECPIALAVKEQYPNSRVKIWEAGFYLGQRVYLLPEEARKFIKLFDNVANCTEIKPFEFDVNEETYLALDENDKLLQHLSTAEGCYDFYSNRS